MNRSATLFYLVITPCALHSGKFFPHSVGMFSTLYIYNNNAWLIYHYYIQFPIWYVLHFPLH